MIRLIELIQLTADMIVIDDVAGFNDFQNGKLTLLNGGWTGSGGGWTGSGGGGYCGWLFRRRMADHRVENVQ